MQKNGDVKNPRSKETRRPRPNNYLLRDLIRILILRELLSGGRPGFPPRPGPNPGPGHGPRKTTNARRTRRKTTNI